MVGVCKPSTHFAVGSAVKEPFVASPQKSTTSTRCEGPANVTTYVGAPAPQLTPFLLCGNVGRPFVSASN
jgi:hypothetical protein